MGQVPEYLIIGNGRVSRHFQHYLSLKKIHYQLWHRREPLQKLTQKIAQATHILLLISDDAIDPFVATHLNKIQSYKIHFSGSLVSDVSYGAHPLMSFTTSLYDLAHYENIPFILDHDAPAFETLFPGLSNPHVRLHKSLKAKYHALCVLSGNFSCMLWQKLFESFENEFNLSAELAHLYLQQQTKNLIQNHKNALTGPLVRNDKVTIKKNIQALSNDPFQEIYQSFISCYQKIKTGVEI